MKKYFMKGTEDELSFGDMIEIDFVGEKKGRVVHNHTEVKFLPELVDLLLSEDIIEEKEIEEEEKLINFGDDNEFEEAIQDLYNKQEIFNEKLAILKSELQSVLSIVDEIKNNHKANRKSTAKK